MKLRMMFLGLAALAAQTALGGENYCLKQVREVLTENFGDKVEILDLTFSTRRVGFSVWIRSNLCDGHLVMRFNPKIESCSVAHYGKVPRYWTSIWATGDCERVLRSTPLPFEALPRR